jgi:hypothetical protein
MDANEAGGDGGASGGTSTKEPRRRASPLLFIVAIVVIALGYVVWSKASHSDEVANDAKVQGYLKRQAAQPHVINGVLTTSLDPNLAIAPPGLIIGLNNGKYGVQALSTQGSQPLFETTAEGDLNKMLTAMVEGAAKEPRLASSDSKHLILTVRTQGFEMQTGVGKLRVGPKPGEDQAQFLKARAIAVEALARYLVTSLKTFTKQLCREPLGVPPPGYQVTPGNGPVSDLRRPIFLLPMDEEMVKASLIRSLQYLIEPRVTGIPERPFTHFWVRGPTSSIDFDIPRLVSKEYPTPLDLAKAQETVIEQRAGEAASQIAALNSRTSKK